MPRVAVERHGERQRIFLVRAAAALAADRHGQFAAGQDHGAAALRACSSRASARVLGRDLARLAFEPVAEQDALVAGRAHGRFGGAERIGRPRDQLDIRVSANAGSPGFGDSLAGSSSARVTASGRSSL